MSSPADTTPPATPAGDQSEQLDPTFKLLFEAAESETKKAADDSVPTSSSGRSLVQAMSEPVADPTAEEKAAKEKSQKEAADKAQKEKDDAAAAAAPAKPIRVRQKKSEPAPTPTPTPTPVAEQPKTKTEDEKFEEGLLEEERDQLELAKYAEKNDPTKYKGYAARVGKFLKEHQTYLEKNPKALEPGSAEADAYQAWLTKNDVKLSSRESRILEVRREAERIADSRIKENDGKFAELHDESFRRDEEPKIKREADVFFNQLAETAIPKELQAAVKELGLEKAKAAHPLEWRISAEEMTRAAADVEEFKLITTSNPKTGRALKAYDANNPQHARILGFITAQCDSFKNGYEGETPANRAARVRLHTKEGKTFITRDEYFSLKPEQRAGHWTFTKDDIVKLQGLAAAREIEARIARENDVRKAEGWTRSTASAPPPKPAPGAPPAPRPTPIPSAGAPVEDKLDKATALMMG